MHPSRHHDSPQPAPPSSQPASLLAVVLFLVFADNFAQFPVLPPYAQELGAAPLTAGVILGIYSLTNMAGNLWVGQRLDRWGYRRPLIASLAATAATLVAYGLVTQAGSLLAVRAVHGLAAAAILPAIFAWRADAGGSLLGGMGRLGAVIGLAAVVMPPAAGIMAARTGYPSLYFALAALFALTALIVWRWAPSDPVSRPSAEQPGGAARPVLKGLRLLWAGGGLLVLTVSTLALRLPLDLGALGLAAEPSRTAGLLLSVFALAASAVMLSLGRRGGAARHQSVQRFTRLAGWGLIIQAVAVTGVALAQTVTLMAVGMGFFGLGFGLAFPAMQAALAARVPPAHRGWGFAVFYACFSLGAFTGPVVAGGVAQWSGPGLLPYLPAAFASMAAGLMLVHQARRQPDAAV